VRRPAFTLIQYDIINADVMGYAGEAMHGYLTAINRAKNTRVLALTTQYMVWFRNKGVFADALRAKYTRTDGSRVQDAHVKAICSWLSNYSLLPAPQGRWTYRKDACHKTMNVLIFIRKE
jgi:hypothetical protein